MLLRSSLRPDDWAQPSALATRSTTVALGSTRAATHSKPRCSSALAAVSNFESRRIMHLACRIRPASHLATSTSNSATTAQPPQSTGPATVAARHAARAAHTATALAAAAASPTATTPTSASATAQAAALATVATPTPWLSPTHSGHAAHCQHQRIAPALF